MADILALELCAYGQAHPAEVFAYGAIYKKDAVMKTALAAFGKINLIIDVPNCRQCSSCRVIWNLSAGQEKPSSCHHGHSGLIADIVPGGLETVSPDLACKIPVEIWHKFEGQRGRVVLGYSSWATVAGNW